MANMVIELEKPFYLAGETINGYVFFNVYRNISGKQLTLKLKGRETVRWIEINQVTSQEEINIIPPQIIHTVKKAEVQEESSDSSGSEIQKSEKFIKKYYYKDQWGQIYKIVRHSEQHIIIKFKYKLYEFGGQYILPGQYTFPFSFKSVENWPITFVDHTLNKQRMGRIKYELTASVKGLKNKKRKQITFKKQIIIRAQVPLETQIKQLEATALSCFCINKGISKIKCYFDKNVYSPGEEATIHCSIDNTKSKKNIKQIEVTMINQITYRSSKDYTKTFQILLFIKSFGGLAAGQKQQRLQVVKISNEQQSFHKSELRSTAKGRYLQSSYFLKVQLEYDSSWTCSHERPILIQPILIYPSIQPLQKWNPPKNWQPKVLPNFQINMGFSGTNQQIQKMKKNYS